MQQTRKPIDSLQMEDLQAWPVWEFVEDDGDEEEDETWVNPVDAAEIPLETNSLIVSTTFKSASGTTYAGFLNVLIDEEIELGGGVLFHRNERVFVPSPEFGHAEAELSELAKMLNSAESDVFPLQFELAVPVAGESAARSGSFHQ